MQERCQALGKPDTHDAVGKCMRQRVLVWGSSPCLFLVTQLWSLLSSLRLKVLMCEMSINNTCPGHLLELF